MSSRNSLVSNLSMKDFAKLEKVRVAEMFEQKENKLEHLKKKFGSIV